MRGIVLYGGTFNPIHPGHIGICRAANALLSPEKIILMPTASPPHKEPKELAPGTDRLDMCRAAVRDMPYIEVSSYEVDKGGKSYTVDTLGYLREQYPEHKIYLLIGTDMFLTFEEWRRWQDIGGLATLVAASRQDDDMAALEAKQNTLAAAGVQSVLLKNEVLELSSTEVRADLRSDGFSPLIDPAVMGLIWSRGLYGCSAADRTPEHLRQIVRAMVSAKRYIHILGVEKAAIHLAERYGADAEKARTAGILHDICKYMEPDAALHLIRKSDIITDIDFSASPQLLHSYAGAEYIKLLGIDDPDIVNAVRYHTTARAGMSALEQCVYLADLISEERDYPDVADMRAAAESSLADGMRYALEYIIPNLKERGLPICADTWAAYHRYCASEEQKGGVSMTPKEFTIECARILSEKKAADISAVETKGLTTLADYFVIASAGNTTHVKALSDELELKLKQQFGVLPKRVEGYQTANWILLDYGDVLVHIFYKETRDFYGIERLWADAPHIDLSSAVSD